MPRALLFPGQGSQHVGMGRELAAAFPEAREVFEEADDVLDFGLSALMFEGPEDELKLTVNAQPALLLHSVAVLRVLGDRLGPVAYAAGHSLGEFSAHVAAGTLSWTDALRAVRRRGELMLAAGRERPGTMAAVLGLADEAVVGVCAQVTSGVCVPANFNSEGQVVVSGDAAALAEAEGLLTAAGAKRVVGLPVSGAFHSPLMEPAASGLAEHLAGIAFADPAYPVVSNVTAAPVTTGAEARDLLVRQITAPVRWTDSVGRLVADGVDSFLEIGAGSVLCGLNRRNARGLPCRSVGTPADLDALELA